MYGNLSTRKILISLFIIILITVVMNFYSRADTKQDIRSKAADTRNNLSTMDNGSITDIQSAIDSAKDGDTVNIPANTYTGATALPSESEGVPINNERGGAKTCFIKIVGKKLTLKGPGAVLFGEGHDKPYLDPYQTRAGVCIYNSEITIDGLKIKEFQKRCMLVYNSRLVVKNSVIEGCDEGGVSMMGNSSGLFVNNYFVATGAVLMWQNSYAKLINNTIYASNIQFFLHPNSNDQARVEAINNIIVNGENTIVQVGWWPSEVGLLKNSKFSYNLIWKEGKECYPPLEYCDTFTGKVIGDPLFIEPVIDQRGIAAWANFGLKDGSPAIGAGDPNIPGGKNLGVSGGPCTDGNSSICLDYISTEKNNLQPPSSPTTIVPSIDYPTSEPSTSFLQPTSSAKPSSGSLKPTISEEPPISYYMPPTIPNNNPPNQIGNPQPSNGNQPAAETTPINSPTPQPTKAPIIDVKKTVENAKNSLKTFISNVITFTQNILP